jgi:hypothetical protein
MIDLLHSKACYHAAKGVESFFATGVWAILRRHSAEVRLAWLGCMRQNPLPSESVAAAVDLLSRRVRTAKQAESFAVAVVRGREGPEAPGMTTAGESGLAAEHNVNEMRGAPEGFCAPTAWRAHGR